MLKKKFTKKKKKKSKQTTKSENNSDLFKNRQISYFTYFSKEKRKV